MLNCLFHKLFMLAKLVLQADLILLISQSKWSFIIVCRRCHYVKIPVSKGSLIDLVYES